MYQNHYSVNIFLIDEKGTLFNINNKKFKKECLFKFISDSYSFFHFNSNKLITIGE